MGLDRMYMVSISYNYAVLIAEIYFIWNDSAKTYFFCILDIFFFVQFYWYFPCIFNVEFCVTLFRLHNKFGVSASDWIIWKWMDSHITDSSLHQHRIASHLSLEWFLGEFLKRLSDWDLFYISKEEAILFMYIFIFQFQWGFFIEFGLYKIISNWFVYLEI